MLSTFGMERKRCSTTGLIELSILLAGVIFGPITGLCDEFSGVHFEELRREGIRDPEGIAFTFDSVAVVDVGEVLR